MNLIHRPISAKLSKAAKNTHEEKRKSGGGAGYGNYVSRSNKQVLFIVRVVACRLRRWWGVVNASADDNAAMSTRAIDVVRLDD